MRLARRALARSKYSGRTAGRLEPVTHHRPDPVTPSGSLAVGTPTLIDQCIDMLTACGSGPEPDDNLPKDYPAARTLFGLT